MKPVPVEMSHCREDYVQQCDEGSDNPTATLTAPLCDSGEPRHPRQAGRESRNSREGPTAGDPSFHRSQALQCCTRFQGKDWAEGKRRARCMSSEYVETWRPPIFASTTSSLGAKGSPAFLPRYIHSSLTQLSAYSKSSVRPRLRRSLALFVG